MTIKDLLKAGAQTQPSYAMKGRLVVSKSGWLLLEVPNAVMRGIFNTIDEPGIELPSYEGRINAHISVMNPDDLDKIGGPAKITERGQFFAYTLGPLRTVVPKIPGISRVWLVEVKSPDLAKLRRSYGLPSLPHDGEYPFHITVAQRKINVLGDNQITKGNVQLRDDTSDFDKLDNNDFVGSQTFKVAELFGDAVRDRIAGGAGSQNGGPLCEKRHRELSAVLAEIAAREPADVSLGKAGVDRSGNEGILATYGISQEKDAAEAAAREFAERGDDNPFSDLVDHLVVGALAKEAEQATGIPDRKYYGEPTKIPSGSLQDLIVQHHLARKAGPHYDIRFGGPQGLFSWAARHPLPGPGQKRLAVQQPMHSYKYREFEGEIPKGYGAGKVSKHEEGQLLFTKVSPDMIHFTTAHRRHPERFVMFKPKGWGEKDWMIMNVTPTEAVPYEKVRYKKVPADQVEQLIQKMQHGETIEAKVDGASSLIKILKDGVEMVSYRTSKETGRPIVHTERFFHGRPERTIDPSLVGTVLKGELYGVRRRGADNQAGNDGRPEIPAGAGAGADQAGEQLIPGGSAGENREPGTVGSSDAGARGEPAEPQWTAGGVVPPQELGRILNATVANAIQAQKERGIDLKNMVYDIQQLGDKPVDWHTVPRAERRQMIEKVLDALDPDRERFHISPAATTPEEAQKLWEDVRSGKHPLTQEGIVYHPLHGTPSKAKLMEDVDVHITGMFPGEGKYKDVGAGGLTYALEAGGPTVGRIGTGFTDELRRDIFENPEAYTGRIARIRSQQQLPSGAYRVPAFISLHEDYPASTKVAVAKGDESAFFEYMVCHNREDRDSGEVMHISDKERKRLEREWQSLTPEKKLRYHRQAKWAADKEHVPTVAVDMDGTLAKHYEKYDPDSIPDPRPDAKKTMQAWRDKGYRLVIFTVRGNKKLVKDWLVEHEIPYDYINENPDQPEDASDKIMADVYVDDRAVDGARSWKVIAETAGKRLEKKSTTLKQTIANAVRQIRKPVSEAQADAGNYRMGHFAWKGLQISIETKAGEKRRPEWPALKWSYGYIRQTEDKDGDHIDVIIGPEPDVELVYVVDQVDPKTKHFDEHKVVLGSPSLAEAKQIYLDNYEQGWGGLGNITPLTVQQFKEWLKTGDQQKSLGSQVVMIKSAGLDVPVLVCTHKEKITLVAS